MLAGRGGGDMLHGVPCVGLCTQIGVRLLRSVAAGPAKCCCMWVLQGDSAKGSDIGVLSGECCLRVWHGGLHGGCWVRLLRGGYCRGGGVGVGCWTLSVVLLRGGCRMGVLQGHTVSLSRYDRSLTWHHDSHLLSCHF